MFLSISRFTDVFIFLNNCMHDNQECFYHSLNLPSNIWNHHLIFSTYHSLLSDELTVVTNKTSIRLFQNTIYYNFTSLHFTLLYFTLLCFTLLYFTLLCFALLCFTLLYFTLLYFTLLYFSFLYLTLPYLTFLYSTFTLFYFTSTIHIFFYFILSQFINLPPEGLRALRLEERKNKQEKAARKSDMDEMYESIRIVKEIENEEKDVRITFILQLNRFVFLFLK